MKYRDGMHVELEDRVLVCSFGVAMEASVVFLSSPPQATSGYEWLASQFTSKCIAIRWENQVRAEELYWPSSKAGEMADFLIIDSDDEDITFVSRGIK